MDIKFLTSYVQKSIYSYGAYFVGCLIIWSVYLTLFENYLTKHGVNTKIQIIGIIFGCILWFIYWIIKKYYFPQTAKDCIGVILAIRTENDDQKEKIKADFAEHLKRMLQENNLSANIDVVVFDNHQADRLKGILENYAKVVESPDALSTKEIKKYKKDWLEAEKRIHGHFFIWGTVKIRNKPNSEYFFDTKAFVAHKEVDRVLALQLKNDFVSVWKNTIRFSETAESEGFAFAAEWVHIAVEYVAGIAAYISGDVFTANSLHEHLVKYFRIKQTIPLELKNIKQKTHEFAAVEYNIIAKIYFAKGNLPKTKEILEKAFAIKSDNYPALILRSNVEFMENEPEKALVTTCDAENLLSADPIWRYNKAFLLMYLGRHSEAMTLYKYIANCDFQNEEEILKEVLEFNTNLLKKEPNKIFCHYILGYLYFKKQGNYPLALIHLDDFLQKAKGENGYKKMITKAIAYKTILEREMGLH